ncbi:MAG: hypothetical protein ABSA93_31650 [Streptosporangiaceae bacterium]|jgi:hypothetical protein
MDDKTAGGRTRWRGWPQGWVILIVMAGIALLASGCGGGGTPTGSAASPSATTGSGKALAYSECIRSHGVPDFPDPSANGNVQISGNEGVSQSVMQAALQACSALQPGGTSGVSSAQNIAEGLNYAKCMRSHGEPNWPDPSSDGSFKITASMGISLSSSAVQAAEQACQSVQPKGLNIGSVSS